MARSAPAVNGRGCAARRHEKIEPLERRNVLAGLAAMIRARKGPRPLKVAIDGRCAAGKTSLADELAFDLRATGLDILRPSVDGFHHPRAYRYRQGELSAKGYYDDAFDYHAVIDGLLAPLSRDRFPAECRQVAHDVRTDLPSDAPSVLAGTNTILLFDGLFLFRAELNPYWDFRILLDVDAATSVDRAVHRDGGDSEAAIRQKYSLRYEPAWLMYVRLEQPEQKADVIVDNRDLARPRLTSGKTPV